MAIQVIKIKQGIIRKVSENYKVTNYLTKDSSKNVSLSVSEATNHFEITKNVRSDRIYYVLEGNLIVKENNNEFVAEPGDAIFIPKNTEYNFGGTFKAVLINSPAFSLQDERILKL